MESNEQLEELKEFMASDAPLTLLQEFTLSAMNGLLQQNSKDIKFVAAQSVKIALATLTELHQTERNLYDEKTG